MYYEIEWLLDTEDTQKVKGVDQGQPVQFVRLLKQN